MDLMPLYLVYLWNKIRYRLQYRHASVSARSILSNTVLGNGVSVSGGVRIANSTIGDHTYISGSDAGGTCSRIYNATIGKYCSIAHNLEITTSNDHSADCVSTCAQGQAACPNLRVTIGNNVWVGVNVTILGGSAIGDGAIIGAGAVVKGQVEPYTVVGGVPARVIKYRFKPDQEKALSAIAWWYWPDYKVDMYRDLLYGPIEKFLKETI